MKIGVISDTHDKLEKTAEAIRQLTNQGAELLIHCGDITTAKSVRLFDDILTHFVFGNNDNAETLAGPIEEAGCFQQGEFGQIELAGKKIAWVHGHRWGQMHRIEQSNEFDYLFYGHTHVVEMHQTGKTLVANPGALHRARPKTCMIVDLANGELRTLVIEE